MKIYIGNLPWSVDENGLKKLFEGYNIEEVTLIKDRYSGRSKGFGFVTVVSDEEGQKLISEFNGKEVEGRPLKVSEAKPIDLNAPRQRRSFGNRYNRQERF